MTDPKKHIYLPMELAQHILNYLQEQRYRDVAGLIAELMAAANKQEEAKPDPQ